MSRLSQIVRAIEPHPGEHFKDKIIAVSLAFVVWFAVNTEETQPAIFQTVPVSFMNLPPNLALAGDLPDTLAVWVTASPRDLQRVTAGALSPEIDLSNARVGENFYPILPQDLDAPVGVTVDRIEPSQITVTLEERLEKRVPVSAVISGEPAPGFEVEVRATTPEEVRIIGPRSQVAALERIPTSMVDVSGRRESFTQRVTLNAGNLVEVIGPRTVELRIEIVESAATAQFDGVSVEVINSPYRVDVNPEQLSVVLSAPQSVLDRVDVERMRMVIDAEGLQPRVEDYLLEPTVQFEQEGLSEAIEVIGIAPQRRINVHVYNQPSRQ